MLFAMEDVTPSVGNIFMVAGMAITTIGAAVAGLFSYLSGRDKLRFDTELTTLRASHAKCEEDHKHTQAELSAVGIRCDEAEQRSAKRDGEIHGINQLVAELQEELKILRALVYTRT